MNDFTYFLLKIIPLVLTMAFIGEFIKRRYNFVGRIKSEWYDKVIIVNRHLMEQNKAPKYDTIDCFNATYDFTKMIRYFWKRNLNNMVDNQEIYQYVNNIYNEIDLVDLKYGTNNV